MHLGVDIVSFSGISIFMNTMLTYDAFGATATGITISVDAIAMPTPQAVQPL